MKKKKEGKYMKTYKHNNNELITEECLAILHKNAKNIRIRKAEERRRAKRLGFFWTELFESKLMVATTILFLAMFYFGGLLLK
jgi:hypothetical protein